MKTLLSGIMLAVPLLLQNVTGGVTVRGGVTASGFATVAPPACTPPTMTNRWVPTSASTMADMVAGNNATQATTANQPAYTANAVNGHPAYTFDGAATYLNLGTPVGASEANQTWYVIVEAVTTSNARGAMFGGNVNYSALTWLLDTTGQAIKIPDVAGFIGDSNAVSTTSFVTYAFTLTPSASNLYRCLGGTCTLLGSAGGATPPNGVAYFGRGYVDGYYTGKMAEIGHLNSANIAGIGTYSYCFTGN